MKKIFTMLSGLLLASGLTANADEITIDIENEDYEPFADSYTTDLSIDADGNYVIADFLNSGTPLAFSFEQPEVDDWSDITFPNLEMDKEGDADVLTPDGKSIVGYLFGYDGADVAKIFNVFVSGGEYSYVYRNDESEDYEYWASICTCGTDENDDWYDYFYVDFYFNKPEENGVADVKVEAAGKVEYYTLQGVKVAKPASGIFIRKQGNKTTKVAIR